MNEKHPDWFVPATKALRWLEERRIEGDDTFFTPFAISIKAGLSRDIVHLMIQNSGTLLESNGKGFRFNHQVRIEATLNEMVKNGLLKKDEKGYQLMPTGEQFVELLLKTSAQAQEWLKLLKKK
jgi:hypothetical protein